ncbi:hypothetical protein EC957_011040 [Mortierella hygrophila]|uniref:Transmembrane protein n=1 Tax=Mortierella hygrophila TaxID=979708 RepID=A0A9P6EVT5_9FUNG|nr:hypothetical protein EC957_011040 [Mortierella hygrophila]
MTSIPIYTNTCIAPGPSGTFVYLVGVPVTNEGRLEVYTVDLSNINSPVATFLSSQTNAIWTSGTTKACYDFESSQQNSPFILQQFQPNSYFVNIYPNGNISSPGYFNNTQFVTPKLCSVTGATENTVWFTAYVNATANAGPAKTNSLWSGMRIQATNTSESNLNYLSSQYSTSKPLLSVGTYVTASVTMTQGHHIVFDTNGGGVSYTVLDSSAPITSSNYSTVSLSNPQQVNMNGIWLTSNAIAITMDSVAYILDQAPDASIRLYSINPSQSTSLLPVPVSGDVPMFSPFMTVTVLNENIILYSISGVGVATFNSFDTDALVWSGPNLMMPANLPSPPSPSSQPSLSPTSCPDSGCPTPTSHTGAIIGGVVGGLALLAIAAFFLLRYRRKSNKSAPGAVSASSTETENQYMGTVPPMQQNYIQKHQSMQQPQYQQQNQPPTQLQHWQANDPYQSLNPQAYSLNEGSGSPTWTLAQQQQQPSPVIFRPQSQVDATSQAHLQPYMYLPPSVGTVAPQQTNTGINASYTQPVYTQGVSAPHTFYVPASQIHTTPIGSQQNVPQSVPK